MKKIKSITLSVDELSEILAISDPAVREAALKALHQAADDPEHIDLDVYGDAPAVVQTIVRKVHRRAEAAKKRAENKAKKQQETAPTPKTIDVRVNDAMVRRLLWLKHNLPQALDALKRLIEPMKASDKAAGAIADAATLIESYMSGQLRQLIKFADTYFRIPRNLRPDVVELPIVPLSAA